jgi:hypothetical protein
VDFQTHGKTILDLYVRPSTEVWAEEKTLHVTTCRETHLLLLQTERVLAGLTQNR